MPVATRIRTAAEDSAKKTTSMSRSSKHRRLAGEIPALAVRNNGSVDSSCSSDSSSCGSSKKIAERRRRTGDSVRPTPAPKHEERADASERRCDWINQFSDPLYVHFHDKEWGVPIRDDKKLFELLVFSLALAELQWPMILYNREIFRKCFVNFDPSSVAQLDERSLSALKVTGIALLSETKLRAIIENAKQTVKIQREFGSFSNYCWSFVQHRPIQHGFRYVREIPIKTPKAEVISKNLRQKGFTCVGPTIVYSFMQAAGMVNDHLTSCFRFQECKSCIHEQPPT